VRERLNRKLGHLEEETQWIWNPQYNRVKQCTAVADSHGFWYKISYKKGQKGIRVIIILRETELARKKLRKLFFLHHTLLVVLYAFLFFWSFLLLGEKF
jgi:hypothetical protein